MPRSPDPLDFTSDAVRRYAAYMASKKGHIKTAPRSMAPWDENSYFASPVRTTVQLPGGSVVQVVGSNPMRVGLRMQNTSAVNIAIAPDNNVNTTLNNGIQITNGMLPLLILQKDTGPECALEWFAHSVGAGQLYVIEILLNRWPQG